MPRTKRCWPRSRRNTTSATPRPTLSQDGTWRKVEIKVKRPDVKLRSRKGYFAPYKEALALRCLGA